MVQLGRIFRRHPGLPKDEDVQVMANDFADDDHHRRLTEMLVRDDVFVAHVHRNIGTPSYYQVFITPDGVQTCDRVWLCSLLNIAALDEALQGEAVIYETDEFQLSESDDPRDFATAISTLVRRGFGLEKNFTIRTPSTQSSACD